MSVVPEAGALEVDPGGDVVVEFSEELDAETVTAESFAVLDGEVALEGELVYQDKKVTFKPALPLRLGTRYTLSIANTIADVDGEALANAFTSSFTVREGAWKLMDVIKETLGKLSPQLPMTSTGEVLVAWLGARGEECPASARWFARGAAATPLITFSDAVGTDNDCRWITSAANADGVASVAWSSITPKRGRYARVFRNDRWQQTSALVDPGPTGYYFKTGVTPAGTALLFEGTYDETPRVWSTSANDTWATKPSVLSPAVVSTEFLPTIGFDAKGDGLVVWHGMAQEAEATHAATFDSESGSFSPGVKVADGRSDGGDPSLAVTPDGQAVALWYIGEGARIDASYFSAGTWSKAETISSNGHTVAFYSARSLVWDGQRFIAAWDAIEGTDWRSYTALFDPTTGWTIPEPHQNAGEAQLVSGTTRLATDGHGTTLLVWASRSTTSSVQLSAQRYRDGAWEASAPIPGAQVGSEYFYDLALSMNASGMAAASWVDRDAKGNAIGIRLATLY